MGYKEKLKSERFRKSSISGRSFNEEMESDRGRAINSAAVRRLQQKTQVFPLESNAAVRSRLTHSLEVQQVGRYISKCILERFRCEGDEYGLLEFSEGFVSAVEISCLLHDIGNPPFGHFGEEAINLWAKSFLKENIKSKYGHEHDCDKIIEDLCNFEGNAQCLRLLHNIQDLNLTYTQLACLVKYTRAAYEAEPPSGDAFEYRKKKPGYYFSEECLYEKMKISLGVEDGFRFPLTYIMEAADDISYCIADIEDAIDKNIISIDEVASEIRRIWNSFYDSDDVSSDVLNENYLPKLSEKAMGRADGQTFNRDHEYILSLRTNLINDLVNYAANRYVEHHEKIFLGLAANSECNT